VSCEAFSSCGAAAAAEFVAGGALLIDSSSYLRFLYRKEGS